MVLYVAFAAFVFSMVALTFLTVKQRYFSYDLYNTQTEQVEATEQHTPEDIAERNNILRTNGEPKRWIATPWVNH